MISKEIATKVLEQCLVTGGDFAEIFEEDCINNNLMLIDSKIENVLGGRTYGIGIRIFKGFNSVYAYTNDNSLESMLDTAYKAALALGRVGEEKMIVLNEREKEIITKRYGLNNTNEVTQKEIAKELGISRSYVSRIEKRALTKMLREFIKNKNHTF